MTLEITWIHFKVRTFLAKYGTASLIDIDSAVHYTRFSDIPTKPDALEDATKSTSRNLLSPEICLTGTLAETSYEVA
jgi:hypothetical protein